MRISPLTILLLPLTLFCAQTTLLKSAITVERGEYRKGWENDFFREADREPVPIETPDTLAVPSPEHAAKPTADPPRPRKSAPSLHRREADALPALPPSSEKNTEPVPESAPTSPPVEKLPPPPQPEPPLLPVPSRGTPTPETVEHDPEDDTKKKQKERSRELEKRRKKGNFRDPKITY